MAFLASANYFLSKDYRNELKDWIKRNCLDPVRFLKYQVIKYRLLEVLSMELVARKKQGIQALEIEYEIERCGKHGECQKHKQSGESRFIGYYCNERSFHLPCAIRYRSGQGVEMKNQYLEIAKANDLWGFYSWVFTLPQEVNEWIDQNPQEAKALLLDIRRAIAKTIKEILGLNTKARNIQPGFQLIYHPCSSSNPFKGFSHFHALIIPMVADLKTGKLTKFERRLSHSMVKKLYKIHLDTVLKKYGFKEFIKPGYDVKLKYIECKYPKKIAHEFRYVNRSQIEDVLKVIKRASDDFERFICVQIEKEKGFYIPSIKTRKHILNALEFILNPVIQIRMAYGFMRVIEKYSKLLGIQRDEYQDDKNWQKLYEIQIMRVIWNVYDKDQKKVKTVMIVKVKKSDSNEAWTKIKPDELRGERASMQNRKLYKARI